MKNSSFGINFKPVGMVRIAGFLFIAGFLVGITSCGSIKNLQYVQGPFDTAQLSRLKYAEPLIQKGDLLSITVYSDDALSTAAITHQNLNTPTNTATNSEYLTGNAPAPTSSTGFLVNTNGEIQLFKLGTIHAEGMTSKQLSDTLASLYERAGLLKNAYVEVRYLNFKITLVGEVSKPGSYTIPATRINAFEAIGLAGDITLYGRRDNVLVVREVNGKREFGRLDFSKPDVFASPFFNLQQNDLIIVDVGKNKQAANDQTTVRNITIATSIVATIAILINVLR